MIKKFFSKVWENILFLETLILLAFIPLYPKIPLINVRHTWVYVRVEDFLIVIALLTWVILLLKRKITLKTPLTIPIFIFWIIGAIATLNGVLLIFPDLANVFPNVAFLAFVRHIEYLSLFFIAFHGLKDRNFLKIFLGVLVATVLGVIFYGFGQKYLGFPAFLTSNEEFAKGIPIQLSALSRVPSTFAGHYDLAAYLVLVIPILVSLIFGIKNFSLKIFLAAVTLLSFVLLFWTVSRISLIVVVLSLFVVLSFYKRRFVLFSIPILIVAGFLFLSLEPTILDRYKSTVSEVDVLVDAKTGDSVGHVQFVPKEYFKDKIVLQKRVKDESELVSAMTGDSQGSPSAILPFKYIPEEVAMVKAVNVSNGENLPQGTGYINLTLSPVVRRVGNFFYEFPPNIKSSPSADFIVLHGDFIIKRASAYDLSFTTRFQGEWPRAVEAFQRNVLVGSGYSSVSLAVDNNFLRILGETGLLGFSSFFIIFLSFGIYLKKAWPKIKPGIEKSFIIGFLGGLTGLFLNGTLIDVFEASKVAYTLWILLGVSLAIALFSYKLPVNLWSELKKLALSPYAILIYLFAFNFVLYSRMISNFFIGDDFTWFRWAAQAPSNLLSFFTQSDGFFYRPGTKLYFYGMYNFFWLNPVVYHLVSLFSHFAVASLFFLLCRKIFKNVVLCAGAAFLFLIISGYSEMVLWVASTGHIFNALFGLLGLLSFIKWNESKKTYFYALSFISFTLSLLFHELGVFLPLLVVAFYAKDGLSKALEILKRKDFLFLYTPVIFYLIMRFFANSHWFSGDYSYDVLKFPFNFIGNIFGYVLLTFAGNPSINIYETVRAFSRDNLFISAAFLIVIIGLSFYVLKWLRKTLVSEEKRVISFGILFFLTSLAPFLGLGNITSRYSYLASLGLVIILVVFLKRIYAYLLVSGKQIAVGAFSIIILVYSLFHIINLQQSLADYAGAATKVNNFFVYFESYYTNYWSRDDIGFHFVNVPIKAGEAWVFPVGLKDAVWFAVKNDKAKIYIDESEDVALEAVGTSRRDKIFLFNDDGSLKEITKRNIAKNEF